MEENHELDEVTALSAFSIGEPGKRTFFLVLGQEEEWIRAWLEKEQLQVLGLAIDQFFFTIIKEPPRFPSEGEGKPITNDVPSGLPSVEYEIDQIALGYDRGTAILDLLVHKPANPEEEQVELNCRVTLTQLKELGNQAKEICAAGRPRCTLCGGPIDPSGHICPRLN